MATMKLIAGADVAEQQLGNEEALLILPHSYDPDEEDELAYCILALAPEEHASMEEALAGPDGEKWLVSRDAEYQSLTSSCDESLFLKGEGEKLVLFLVYVDDILLFNSSMKEIQKVQQQLMKNFKCKTLGEVKYYLGMHVERDVDHRWLKLYPEKLMWAYLLKQTDHAASTIREDWLPFVEKQAECMVKRIRTDRGGEFLGAEMTAWLKKQGIQRELTTAYTPQSNGVADRANRTILEAARALLIESGVGNSMWPHAVWHATVARNRVHTKIGNESWVPLEKWLWRKPPVDMLRVFSHLHPQEVLK
ncbi:unnamed protein product [Closterium sp. NIES-54]